MNEDDNARREFVFGLFLITVIAPLAAGLATFAAILGAARISETLPRLRDNRRATTDGSAPARLAAPRHRRHTNHRHTRRAVSTRRPGGVLH
ncbi:hypothetical protein [Nocardia concava]|uniref:hypothetical protein n=1 Tax=Nocardia concava TaxID=257281 RepID=UPI0002DAE9B3|nr:hypothetical protein [Nocardia concava]